MGLKEMVARRKELAKSDKVPVPGSPMSYGEYAQNELQMILAMNEKQIVQYCEKRFPDALGMLQSMKEVEHQRAYVIWILGFFRTFCTYNQIDWATEIQRLGPAGGVTCVESADPLPPEEAAEQVRLNSEMPMIKAISKHPVSVGGAVRALMRYGKKNDLEAWQEEKVVKAKLQGFIARIRSDQKANPSVCVRIEDHDGGKIQMVKVGDSE